MQISRRNFFLNLGITGLGIISSPNILLAKNRSKHYLKNTKGTGLTFLFQGDSITDGKRSRNKDWNHVMGHGYAYLIASRLWFDYTNEDLMFYNRGISGNKITDLNARWQQDTIDLNPDVLSILIGVNDVPKIIENEYSIKKWEETYIQVLDKTIKALPNTQIILCEPFILPSNNMVRIDWTKEKTESYQSVISEMQKIVRQLADAYKATLIELQQPFLDACKKAPAKYWIWDGVHPMPAGHELIARTWINEVSKKLNFIGHDYLKD
ncbi:SGNH/GDSL hydrolase family protein [Sabulilitoribacter arenilitoris]|uniref:SGNH/GDSL hydrolase family protein n=1 Tax=Wocania arenilitoris TaxID=2044858 RepID=A0AAE3EL23_9FLAO|nr:SGNH/GDSL hydrolase family protein [Wocania arenilitoris]MCF7566846.1 SGNH/GDSL hydrolase family protein [Wocania arenilitoris]